MNELPKEYNGIPVKLIETPTLFDKIYGISGFFDSKNNVIYINPNQSRDLDKTLQHEYLHSQSPLKNFHNSKLMIASAMLGSIVVLLNMKLLSLLFFTPFLLLMAEEFVIFHKTKDVFSLAFVKKIGWFLAVPVIMFLMTWIVW